MCVLKLKNELFRSKLLFLCALYTICSFVPPSLARSSFRNDNLISKRDFDDTEFPACKVYCHGPLLHTVQKAQLFDDSKTFVDMKLKYSPGQTTDNFEKFMVSKNNTPSKDDIKGFVNDHFDDMGKEFAAWTPNDWKDHPAFLDLIRDPDLRQWGNDLNGIWKELGRKMIDDVYTHPEYYSIIPVPNPVIVPGGRFIEFYYWDSYWIIRGLLYSEMYNTARGMIENFMSIIQRYGFIPNGGRIYYSNRSQPPLLAGMIKSYVEFTKDEAFGISALDILEHEFEYWINNHTVQAKGHNVCIYGDTSTGPRPESYREDIEIAKIFPTEQEKELLYAEVKAAAESGMDFTSRWFINNKGSYEGNLTDIKTRSIVPVELNAILYWNAKIIAEFHMKNNNAAKMAEYQAKAQKILEAIQAVHWSEEVGAWLDFDLLNQKPRDFFVPTNLSPLWTKAFDLTNATKISAKILSYIERLGLDKYPGGVPNTLYRTGEQWDFPNVWPPMQYILIEGLDNLGIPEAKNLSMKWGYRWVKSNFEAYRESRAMFEKYDAERFGGHGGGGEYVIQRGFGWTNGVIIELLAKYGNEITLSNEGNAAVPTGNLLSILGAIITALITTLFGRFLR